MSSHEPLPTFPVGSGAQPLPDTPDLASWGRRVGAYVLDSVLGLVAAILITRAAGHQDPLSVLHFHVVNGKKQLVPIGSKLVFFYVVSGATQILYTLGFLTSRWRATLGMRWLGIFLARESDLGQVGPAQVAGRTGLYPGLSSVVQVVLPIVSLLVFVDLLWPLWDPRNQTLHDKVAGTVVLRQVSGR
jgi:uncharacterized RDD family membrane protein YckC